MWYVIRLFVTEYQYTCCSVVYLCVFSYYVVKGAPDPECSDPLRSGPDLLP